MAVDPHIRVALFEAYSEICQWCKHPLVFADMQIDHIFPENSTPEKLAEMIEMHGQPSDFDVHATYNLVPTCGPANRHKSDRIPPVAPVITFMLETARKKAPVVEARAGRFKSRNMLDKQAAILIGNPDIRGMSEDKKREVMIAMYGFSVAFRAETGIQLTPHQIHRDYHEFVTPDLVDVSDQQEFYENDMFGVLQAWMERYDDEATELIAGTFDHDQGRLMSAGISDVSRLAFAPGLGNYLVRAEVSIEYMYYPDDEVPAPADGHTTIDLWVELDEPRSRVISVAADLWNSFEN